MVGLVRSFGVGIIEQLGEVGGCLVNALLEVSEPTVSVRS